MDIKTIIKNIQDKIKKIKKTKKIDRNIILMAVAIVFVLITGIIVLMNLGPSDQTIAKSSVDYINKNLLQGQATATLGDISRDNGLVKFQITVSGQTFDSYATKDGKLFFPQGFNLKEPYNPTPTPATGQ